MVMGREIRQLEYRIRQLKMDVDILKIEDRRQMWNFIEQPLRFLRRVVCRHFNHYIIYNAEEIVEKTKETTRIKKTYW